MTATLLVSATLVMGALTDIGYTAEHPTFQVVIACEAVLDGVPDYDERYNVCVEVGLRAPAYNVDPEIAIAVGWIESRHKPEARSHAGAIGPLQVLPRYWCPGRTADHCDLITAGLSALAHMKTRFGQDYMCHYNSGNHCNSRSRTYARMVEATTRRLRTAVRVACGREYLMCCLEETYYERYS